MKKRILVIEDDPASMRLTQYILEHKGYKVILAVNGLDVLKKAKTEAPDLIVLDVMLPGIDGFGICSNLRAEPETAKLPIIMLSAKARDVDRDTGLKVGADLYITKPVSPDKIAESVETLLSRGTRDASVPEKEVEKRKARTA